MRTLGWLSVLIPLMGCVDRDHHSAATGALECVARDSKPDTTSPRGVPILTAPDTTPKLSDTLREIGRRFYEDHPDEFDQLVMWTNPELYYPATFYLPIRSETPGLGSQPLDESVDVGTKNLMGIILMGNGWEKPVERPDGPDSALGVLAQESAHAWAVHFRYEPDSATERVAPLLGREHAHWSFFVDTGGSPLGGNKWRHLGGDWFVADPPTAIRYGDLDLYAMGLLPPGAVRPTAIITPLRPCEECRGDHAGRRVVVEAKQTWVTIGHVVAMNGERPPSSPAWTLRQAWIYLSPNQTRSTIRVHDVDRLCARWPGVFASATRQLGRVIVNCGATGEALSLGSTRGDGA